jgi:hypothetical protein
MTSTVTLYSLTIVFSEVSRLHSCFGTCAAPATAQWVPVSNPGVAHRPVGPGSRREYQAQARFPYLFAQVPPATTCWPGRTVCSRSAAKLLPVWTLSQLPGCGGKLLPELPDGPERQEAGGRDEDTVSTQPTQPAVGFTISSGGDMADSYSGSQQPKGGHSTSAFRVENWTAHPAAPAEARRTPPPPSSEAKVPVPGG